MTALATEATGLAIPGTPGLRTHGQWTAAAATAVRMALAATRQHPEATDPAIAGTPRLRTHGQPTAAAVATAVRQSVQISSPADHPMTARAIAATPGLRTHARPAAARQAVR